MPFDINGGYIPDDTQEPSPANDWLHWLTSGNKTPPTVSLSGAYVPPAAMPTPAQANAADPLGAAARAIVPAIAPAAPPAPPAPAPAPPQEGVVDNGAFDVPAAAPAPPQAPPKPLPAPRQAAPAPAPQAPPQDEYAALNLPSQGSEAGNYYASAIPPPSSAMQGVVASAAQKYNVPLPVATWVGYHESGWNPAAVGPQTSSGRAQGAWQFMPDTAQQYGLQDPHDFATATDAAMHKLSDLAQKNGGNWEKAIGDYGTFSTGQGAQKDAAARNGFRQFVGQGPMLAATEAQPGQPEGGMGAGLPGSLNPQMPYSTADLQLPRGMPLLALASGLLSGPDFGRGLGKGLASMNQLQLSDIANKRASNSQAIQLANIGLMDRYRMGMLANSSGRLANQTQNTTNNTNRTGGYLQSVNARTDPNQVAALTGAKVGAGAEAKDTQEDVDQMLEAGANAPAKEMQIQQLQQLLPTAGTGPGLAAIKRNIANYFGVDLGAIGGPNASSAQLAAAVQSQLRGSGIMGKNMRTQREFNTVMEGLPNMDQNPQVAASVITGLKNFNDFNQQASQAWLSLPQSQRAAMRGDQDQFQQWRLGQLQQWRQGVEKNGGIYGTPNASAPASQPTQGNNVSGSYNGLKYSFTPG